MGYAKDVLVETDWLSENIDDPDIRIVDVDEDISLYEQGHIRNAVGLNWRTDLQDPVRRDFIGPEAFAQLQDRIGVTPSTKVVLYGGNNNWFAAYAYWYYRYYGHTNVVLLNGGRVKWIKEERELTTDPPKADSTSGYPVPKTDESIRALRDFVGGTLIGNDAFGLVDVRSPDEFSGALLAPAHLPQEAAQRGGHIPGARNIPWSKTVDPDTGAFKSSDELKALYEGQGITPEKEVVAYCRIGERSAHSWFVLHELLGYSKVRNYDGSWTEWGSLVGVPIEV
ncbi:MAG: sulfurtransferase [Actinomycetota bacterium]